MIDASGSFQTISSSGTDVKAQRFSRGYIFGPDLHFRSAVANATNVNDLIIDKTELKQKAFETSMD